MSDSFAAAKSLFLHGVAAFEAGNFAEAEQDLQASLALVPGRPSTLLNLGATYLKLGRLDEAVAALDRSVAADAAQPTAWAHRGTALMQLGHDADAITSFERALGLEPRLAPAWSQLGQLLKEVGRWDEARNAFERAIEHGADAELNRYFLAAMNSGDAPPASPHAYVRGLFDHYADDFEPHLLNVLRYRAHETVVGAAAAVCVAPVASALDLGCGTGLCGPLLKAFCTRVDGVDLSPTMLAAARGRSVYDALVEADVAEHLHTTPERYGLVVSTDVFIYVGDLDPVFAGVRRVLTASGVFAFSVEATADSGYVLQPSMRYAHSEAYLRKLAAAHGFDVLGVTPTVLREDQQRPIAGLVITLRAS